MNPSTETRIEKGLRAALDRVTCPTPQELGEFRLGILAADESEHVARHLIACGACREEMALLEGFVPLDPAKVMAEIGDPTFVAVAPRRQRLWLQVVDAVTGEHRRLAFALGELGSLLDRVTGPGGLGRTTDLLRGGSAALAAGLRGSETAATAVESDAGDRLTFEIEAVAGDTATLRVHGAIDSSVNIDDREAQLVLDDGTVLAHGQIEFGMVDLLARVP